MCMIPYRNIGNIGIDIKDAKAAKDRQPRF
jgi:hypothetical protein